MQWTIRRLSPPQNRALTLAEVKKNQRIGAANTYLDSEILLQIEAATEQLERETNRILIHQQFEWSTERFPSGSGMIELSQKPIASIDSIEYLDPVYQNATMDPADYMLDEGARLIYLAPGAVWPEASRYHRSVRVTYTAGYGANHTSIPQDIREALLLLVGIRLDPMAVGVEKATAAYERIAKSLAPSNAEGVRP